jgi:two-component system CheB/CheR fusion protein
MLNRLAHDFAFRAGSGGNVWRVVPSRLVVRSDPKLLERILRNLLSNAFKYTDHGKVLLGCRRHGSHVRIDVCDNGVGIPADQIADIFKEYVQIESSIRPCRGLGLGLAIVRRQAALLNHTLCVRSTPGRGSVFSIEIPLAKAETAAQVVAPPVAPLNAPILQRKILVVEGDETVSGTLKSLFLSEGAAVVTTSDESKLAAIIEQMSGAPDLLVTDYALPDGLTGLDVVARVRAATSSDLPAIVLTRDIPAETVREIAAVPGCLHLPKPVTFSELMRSAAILLSRSARRAAAAAKGATVFVIDDDGPLREAMASLLEEEGLPVELYPHAEAFLEHVGPSRQGCLLIDAVMPGMGGLELLRHLRSRNSRLPAIMMTGHGDVAMAVAAMKAGAIDFVSKPVHPAGLLATVGRAMEIERDMVAEMMQREEAMVLISSLTPREYDVLEQLLAGHRNKTIAYCLGISQRTVENHRAAVMRKTKSKALFDLLQTVIIARS